MSDYDLKTIIQPVIVIILSAFVIKRVLFPKVKTTEPNFNAKGQDNTELEPIVLGNLTRQELKKYNGVIDPRVFIAVCGKIYDVTAGKNFYGPKGPYANFAGNDASRGLAKNSFDPSVITPISEPIDKLDDLTDSETKSLKEWEALFIRKYQYIGDLVE